MMSGQRSLSRPRPNLLSLNPRQPNVAAVTQLIKLAGLGAQHAGKVMSGIAAQDRAPTYELVNEKAPPHEDILSQLQVESLLLCPRITFRIVCHKLRHPEHL